jgi:hypothetical protein
MLPIGRLCLLLELLGQPVILGQEQSSTERVFESGYEEGGKSEPGYVCAEPLN